MTTTQTPPATPEPAPRDDWNPDEQRKAYTRLAIVIVGVVFGSLALGVAKTVAVVAALLVMIMLHELGHFMTAKWAGMKVTEYFLGFGPRLWSVRRGETEYGVKALPLGGYVKIVGMSTLEEVAPEDEPRTYRQKGYWRRLSVAVAGSTMHFIIAFALLWGMFTFVGMPGDPVPEVSSISRLETGPSPATEAGFQVGDKILAVDGQPVQDWESLPKYIQARPGTAIRFDVQRGGERLTLTATPVDLSKVKVADTDVPVPTEPRGFVGIGPKIPTVRTGPVEGLGDSVTAIGRITKETVKALGKMFSPGGVRGYGDVLTGKGEEDDPNRFLSPVGFVRVAGQAAESGVREVLFLLITINVFVGMFNMIPLLPFDGGHVAVATYEAIRSRKGRRYFVDGRKAMATAYPVVFLLLLIAVTSIYMDIVRPMSDPFR